MFSEKSQVDLPYVDDLIALHVMGVISKYPLLFPFVWGTPEKFGAPVAARALGFLAARSFS